MDQISPASIQESQSQLVVAASLAERVARPRALVLLASILAIGAALFALMQWTTLSASKSSLRTQQERNKRVQALVTQLESVVSAKEALVFEPDSNISKSLEELAINMGISPPVAVTERSNMKDGARQVAYSVIVYATQPAPIINWLVDATAIPGVQLSSLVLTPDKTRPRTPGEDKPVTAPVKEWEANVTFIRWVR